MKNSVPKPADRGAIAQELGALRCVHVAARDETGTRYSLFA